MRIVVILFFVTMICSLQSRTQTESNSEQWEVSYPLSIQDNSFLIEEAFNQEAGVVQHISNVQYFPGSVRRFGFSFTQEWPLWGMTHQFSYQLSYAGISAGTIQGLGDVMLNYRYQLLEKETGVAAAPRFSVSIPTGDVVKELGLGVVGYEVSLPASRRFSEKIIAHVNAGMTLFPHVQGTDQSGNDVNRSLSTYTIGASVIWLIDPVYNLMLEVLHRSAGDIGALGEVEYSNEDVVNPGIRAALNLEHLQIIPGLSIPIRIHEGENEVGLFFYLSFEHGF